MRRTVTLANGDSNDIVCGMTTSTRKLLVRLPEDTHAALRGASYFTGQSMNALVCQAVQEFLTTHRAEHVDAVARRTQAEYGAMLEKLAHM